MYTFLLEEADPRVQTTRQALSPRLQYQVKLGCVCACPYVHTSAAGKHPDILTTAQQL